MSVTLIVHGWTPEPFEVEVSDDTFDALEVIRARTGESMQELIRRAVADYICLRMARTQEAP